MKTGIKNYFFYLLIVLTASNCGIADDDGLFSCVKGEGDVITKELVMSEFKEVKLETSACVYITQGSEFEVIVKGQQNVIDELERDVRDDRWEIEFDDCVKDHEDLIIYITMPVINYLGISGSGKIYGENIFTVDNLDLNISGSGDMDIAVEGATDIESKISGSGKILLEGDSERTIIKISGSGDYRAFDLNTEKAYIDISGSGDAEVRVADFLEIDISGSGDVYYKGNPELDIDISGSGRVVDSN